MYQLRACTLSLIFVLSVVHTPNALATSPVRSSNVANEQEAKLHYNQALELYKRGEYSQALAELLRTRELLKTYEVLYNIGQVRTLLNDPGGALRAYREYLEEGGDAVPASQRQEVQKEIRSLEALVSTLYVESDRAGAEITVDGNRSGATPLTEPLLLAAGTHTIEVRLPSGASQSRQLTLVGARPDRVVFNFGAAAKSSDPAEGSPAGNDASSNQTGIQLNGSTTPRSDHPRNWLDSHTARWAAWSSTGVFAAGAIVTGIVALSANSRLADLRKQPEDKRDYPAMDSESRRTKTFAGVTDGLIVAAVLTGGAALWLTLRAPETSSAHTADTSTRSMQSITLGAGPSSIQLRGEF